MLEFSDSSLLLWEPEFSIFLTKHFISKFSGRVTAKFLSFPLFYSIIIYSAISYFAYLIFMARLKWLTGKSMSFDDSVLHFNASVFMSSHFLPFITFFERRKIADYLDSWNEFQIKYYKVTGSVLTFKLKWKQISFLTVMLILSLLMIYSLSTNRHTEEGQSMANASTDLFVYYLITMMYYGNLMAGVSAFWYFCMSGVGQAATKLLKECQVKKSAPKCSS